MKEIKELIIWTIILSLVMIFIINVSFDIALLNGCEYVYDGWINNTVRCNGVQFSL